MLLYMPGHRLPSRLAKPRCIRGILHQFLVDLEMQHMVLMGIGRRHQWHWSQGHGIFYLSVINRWQLPLQGIGQDLIDSI